MDIKLNGNVTNIDDICTNMLNSKKNREVFSAPDGTKVTISLVKPGSVFKKFTNACFGTKLGVKFNIQIGDSDAKVVEETEFNKKLNEVLLKAKPTSCGPITPDIAVAYKVVIQPEGPRRRHEMRKATIADAHMKESMELVSQIESRFSEFEEKYKKLNMKEKVNGFLEKCNTDYSSTEAKKELDEIRNEISREIGELVDMENILKNDGHHTGEYEVETRINNSIVDLEEMLNESCQIVNDREIFLSGLTPEEAKQVNEIMTKELNPLKDCYDENNKLKMEKKVDDFLDKYKADYSSPKAKEELNKINNDISREKDTLKDLMDKVEGFKNSNIKIYRKIKFFCNRIPDVIGKLDEISKKINKAVEGTQ
jgi:hypothetical protein